MKIKELLLKSQKILKEFNIEDSMLKSRILLADCLEKNKEYVMIHDDELVDEKKEKEFLDKIKLLKENTPLQYILEKAEFMGYEFFVNSNVLIPQPDTEILVEEVISIIKNQNTKKISILDMCTGSGIIAIMLKKNFIDSKVTGCDISSLALDVANKNANMNNVEIEFVESDLFSNLNEKFDIIVSNPPYIKTQVIKELSCEVQKEPYIALDGGEDGLEFYRKIIENSKKYLNPNGIIALEIGFDQKEDVIKILEDNNFTDVYSKKDFGNNDRIVIGKKGKV